MSHATKPDRPLVAVCHTSLAGIAFEEHDLKASLGQACTSYQARVPALIPRQPARYQRGKRSEQENTK